MPGTANYIRQAEVTFKVNLPAGKPTEATYEWEIDIKETFAVHTISVFYSEEILLADMERFMGCAVQLLYGNFRPLHPVWQISRGLGVFPKGAPEAGMAPEPFRVVDHSACSAVVFYKGTTLTVHLVRRDPFTPEGPIEAEIMLQGIVVQEIK